MQVLTSETRADPELEAGDRQCKTAEFAILNTKSVFLTILLLTLYFMTSMASDILLILTYPYASN